MSLNIISIKLILQPSPLNTDFVLFPICSSNNYCSLLSPFTSGNRALMLLFILEFF